jgi:hypothetical protein
VVLKEKTRTAPNTGYAAVTFLSDSNTSGGKIGEALYESATSAEKSDFFSFSEINDGNPVITSTTDTTGLRDPFVLKSHDGDKYYMIATDLKVSQQGWGLNQQYGSLKVEVWESKDMVNWTRTNAEDGDTGITVNSANQGMTWAPEAFWDDSIGAYVVFFSSRAYADDSRSAAVTSTATGNAYNIVRYAITRDFKTFTAAQDWQNTQYSRIDSTVFKIGDYYYRLTKNEESGAAGNYVTTGKTTFLERSKCLTCTTSSSDPDADESTTWRLLDENILPFEGPESIKLNADDVNQNDDGDAMVIMADSSGYKPFMTSQRALSETNWSNRLSQTDGWFEQKAPGANVTGRVNDSGMPTPTRHGAFVNVPQTVLEAMHSTKDGVTGTIQAVDSNTKATYESKTRRISASVTAADDGNVAGSVTFTADDWSQTVTLDTHGVAHIVVPANVSGTVSISYDGYTDGLVNPSQAMVEGIEAVDGAPTQPSLELLSDGKEISRLTMRVGDVKELVGELSAENADGQSVQWSTSDSDIVALIERDSQSRSIATSKQNIKAVKPGTATITLTAADSDISASEEITVMDDQAGTHPESPTETGNDKNPESPLADTGTAIVSVCAAAALLALAGIGTLLWRRRRTQHR